MESRKQVNRREFLRLGALGAIGTALMAACAQTAAPEPTKPAAPATTAPAAQPTATTAAAPAAQATTAPRPTTAPAAQATTAPTVAPKPASTAPVELRWQTPGGVVYPKITERTLTAFTKTHPNYKISPEPAEDDPFEKTFAAMAAGTAPDILEGWGEYFWAYASKGQLVNINDYVKDMDKKDLDDFQDWQWKAFQIPTTSMRFGMPRYVNMVVLYYNKAAFNEAKLDFPTEKWNHDNYQEALIKLTKKTNNKITRWGGWIPAEEWDRMQAHIIMFGGHAVDPSDLTKSKLDEEGAQQGMEWLRKRLWVDNSMAQSMQVEGKWSSSTFPTGMIATAEDGISSLRAIQDTAKFEFDLMHVPQGPAGRAVLGTTDGWAIYKGSKAKAEAWEFTKFVSGVEYSTIQAEEDARVPVRKSVLQDWVKIVRTKYPKLEKVSLNVVTDALTTMGYPRDTESFACMKEASEIVLPALQKVYVTGDTQVTIFKDLKSKIEAAAGICKATFG